jgi:hypothetical protein
MALQPVTVPRTLGHRPASLAARTGRLCRRTELTNARKDGLAAGGLMR